MIFILHTARIAAFLIIFYLLELAASYAPLPGIIRAQSTFDSVYADKSIFSIDSRQVVYDRARISHTGKKIVLVGASTVQRGLRPDQLSKYIPGVEVHNMAVSGGSITEDAEVIQLVLLAIPPESRKDLTIVLGIWYGSFVEAGRRWKSGNTHVAEEMLRYGLYRKNGAQLPAPVVPGGIMPYAISAIRPFMWASHIYNLGVKTYLILLSEKVEGFLTGKDFNAVRALSAGPRTFGRDRWHNFDDYDVHVMTTTEKEMETEFWKDYMGPPQKWDESGYNLLLSIAHKVSSAGAKLVLIDLPIPPWHHKQVAYDRIYQERFSPYLKQISSISGISYGNMRDGFCDDDFHDSAHARPKITELWAKRASQFILPVLRK